jgi:hypothetical protein
VENLVSLELFLPKRIAEKLKKESERMGVSEEELVVKILSETLGESLDPDTSCELHLKLSEKYLREAEEFLAKGDYVQASEKAWGAAAQMVKALAAKEGIELRSHGELHRHVSKLGSERGDREIPRLWLSAVSLHQNFYENWLPGEIVEEGLESVKEFVEKLRKLL